MEEEVFIWAAQTMKDFSMEEWAKIQTNKGRLVPKLSITKDCFYVLSSLPPCVAFKIFLSLWMNLHVSRLILRLGLNAGFKAVHSWQSERIIKRGNQYSRTELAFLANSQES